MVRVLECLEACPDYYPSFEERVAMDVAQVACTMLELCCMKQLRSAMPHPSCPAQRISCVRKVLATGLLRIPRCVATARVPVYSVGGCGVGDIVLMQVAHQNFLLVQT